MPRKETIRFRAPRPKGRFGDPAGPVFPWRDQPGAVVVPRASQEHEQRGEIIIAGFMISLPSAVQIAEDEEVEVRGEVYQIDGAIGDYGKKKIFYVQRVT